jgi:hypothetical protein
MGFYECKKFSWRNVEMAGEVLGSSKNLKARSKKPRCQEAKNKYIKKYKKEQNKFQAKNQNGPEFWGPF